MNNRQQNPLYTAGYTGLSIYDFHRVVETLDVSIVDIRLHPRSRNADWSRLRLRRRFGARYTHVTHLGNLKYRDKEPLPPLLLDWELGLIRVRSVLSDTLRPMLLLCACRNFYKCHREAVAVRLQKEMPWLRIKHLMNADFRNPDAQPLPDVDSIHNRPLWPGWEKGEL